MAFSPQAIAAALMGGSSSMPGLPVLQRTPGGGFGAGPGMQGTPMPQNGMGGLGALAALAPQPQGAPSPTGQPGQFPMTPVRQMFAGAMQQQPPAMSPPPGVGFGGDTAYQVPGGQQSPGAGQMGAPAGFGMNHPWQAMRGQFSPPTPMPSGQPGQRAQGGFGGGFGQ